MGLTVGGRPELFLRDNQSDFVFIRLNGLIRFRARLQRDQTDLIVQMSTTPSKREDAL